MDRPDFDLLVQQFVQSVYSISEHLPMTNETEQRLAETIDFDTGDLGCPQALRKVAELFLRASTIQLDSREELEREETEEQLQEDQAEGRVFRYV